MFVTVFLYFKLILRRINFKKEIQEKQKEKKFTYRYTYAYAIPTYIHTYKIYTISNYVQREVGDFGKLIAKGITERKQVTNNKYPQIINYK